MELKEFVTKAIMDIVVGVEDAASQASRRVSFSNTAAQRTIEFDIATTVEEIKDSEKKIKGGAKASIGSILVATAGAGAEAEHASSSGTRNSRISRIKFGVYVNDQSDKEVEEGRRQIARMNSQRDEFSV